MLPEVQFVPFDPKEGKKMKRDYEAFMAKQNNRSKIRESQKMMSIYKTSRNEKVRPTSFVRGIKSDSNYTNFTGRAKIFNKPKPVPKIVTVPKIVKAPNVVKLPPKLEVKRFQNNTMENDVDLLKKYMAQYGEMANNTIDFNDPQQVQAALRRYQEQYPEQQASNPKTSNTKRFQNHKMDADVALLKTYIAQYGRLPNTKSDFSDPEQVEAALRRYQRQYASSPFNNSSEEEDYEGKVKTD